MAAGMCGLACKYAFWALACCLLVSCASATLSADEETIFALKTACALGDKFSFWPVPDGVGVCSSKFRSSQALAVNCNSNRNIVDLQLGSLGDARLSCLTPILKRFSRLRTLNFTGPGFTGVLPPEWGKLTSLQASLQGLSFRDQYLKGALPSSWAKLTNLRFLEVSGRDCCLNKLTGKLPAAWMALTKLETLNLAYMQVTSPLPPQWNALTRLKVLNLSLNKLTGRIPPSWSRLRSLEQLWLYGPHKLCGPIPGGIRKAVQGYDGTTKCK